MGQKTPRTAEKVISKILSPVERFLELEASSGITLILVTIVAMVLANSPWAEHYEHFLHSALSINFGTHSFSLTIHQWVNDALMVVFFFVVGLEIKRELVVGELATPKKAALPMFAALGGMIAPALIYLSLNPPGTIAHSGWGIPMATDIAFAVGILSLMSKKVPFSLKIFLLALAIVDDLGAVLVIAIFYTSDLAAQPLAMAALGLILVAFLRYAGIRKIPVYVALGVFVWLSVLMSGVHATVAGVLLGLLTPIEPFLNKKDASKKIKDLVDSIDKKLDSKGQEMQQSKYLDEETKEKLEELNDISIEARSPLDRLVHMLHPLVSYFIMPVFAFTNAGVSLKGLDLSALYSNHISLGVIFGLFFGKPLGIILFCFLAIKLKLAQLPSSVNWYQLSCVGFLGGIGFTMALFVSHLALKTPDVEVYSKIGILVGSLFSAVTGLLMLHYSKPLSSKG